MEGHRWRPRDVWQDIKVLAHIKEQIAILQDLSTLLDERLRFRELWIRDKHLPSEGRSGARTDPSLLEELTNSSNSIVQI